MSSPYLQPFVKLTAPGSLANVFIPEGHVRYKKLCDWANAADPRFYRFGVSSDNRPGIWLNRDVWEGNIFASTQK